MAAILIFKVNVIEIVVLLKYWGISQGMDHGSQIEQVSVKAVQCKQSVARKRKMRSELFYAG